ncbi:MAG: type II toxin-antitoxin system RelE/ParE family toxin [Prolixibacteraceae bacterium]|nr:type II toxin-antitoxin system RelE/ParE family toxin [Prolixibacteraceae bacterium]
MQVVYKKSFVKRLERQVEYIAVNNPQNALTFKNELFVKLRKIPKNPYAFRKSVYFDKDEIRDVVFKGYTIVFRINKKTIEVFGFTKFQEKPID